MTLFSESLFMLSSQAVDSEMLYKANKKQED
jgi:hypothetical protein